MRALQYLSDRELPWDRFPAIWLLYSFALFIAGPIFSFLVTSSLPVLRYQLTYVHVLTVSFKVDNVCLRSITLCANVQSAPSTRVNLHTGTPCLSSRRNCTILCHCRLVRRWMHMCLADIMFWFKVSDLLITSDVCDCYTSVACSIVEPLVDRWVSRQILLLAIKTDFSSHNKSGSYFLLPLGWTE